MTPETAEPILKLALNYTENGEELVAADLHSLATIFENCAKMKGSNPKLLHLIFTNINGMLDAREQEYLENLETMGKEEQAAARVLNSMHKLVTHVQGDIEYNAGTNVGLASKYLVDKECNSIGITTLDRRFKSGGDVENLKGESSIILPASFVCGSEGTHAVVTIFKNRKLFVGQGYNTIKQRLDDPLPDEDDDEDDDDDGNKTGTSLPFSQPPPPKPCVRQGFLQDRGNVFTATMMNANNPDNVTFITRASSTASSKVTAKIVIDTSQFTRALHGKYKVSWWDTRNLRWADDGCRVVEGKKGMLTAECEHLTDFTLLIDGRLNDPAVCDIFLIIFGNIINISSILCLFVMLIVTGLG
ncbi:unnamed protein product, partial [Mesorhabditis belari]